MEKLFWIDLEMTGLQVEKERIIECAALITDLNFRVIEKFETAVFQPPEILAKMDAWNQKHHGESGLIERVKTGMSEGALEDALLKLSKTHFTANDKPVLCGNSIAQDRSFIRRYLTRFDQALHYRMLDVSSWKILFQEKFGQTFAKKKSHRAMDDIFESIEEMRFYLQFVSVPSKTA